MYTPSTVASPPPGMPAGPPPMYQPTRRGWLNQDLTTAPTIAKGSCIAVVSRSPDSVEVWWISPDGSVMYSVWYGDIGWSRMQHAGQGHGAAGGIYALKASSSWRSVTWIGPGGSIEELNSDKPREDLNWQRKSPMGNGAAAVGGHLVGLIRGEPSDIFWDLFWLAPSGAVQGTHWDKRNGSANYEVAPANSAAIGALEAVSRSFDSMAVFWISPNGALHYAPWVPTPGWQRFEMAGPGSAAITTHISAVTRNPDTLEVFWIAPNGSVQSGYLCVSEGYGWRFFEIAPAGSAAPGGIKAISKDPLSIELFWTGPDGSLQNSFYPSDTGAWEKFELAPPGSTIPGSAVGAVARHSKALHVFFTKPFGEAGHYYKYS